MSKLAKLYPISLFVYSLLPWIAYAQATLSDIFDDLQVVFNAVIILLVILATLVFIWGVVKFIMAADNEKTRNEAKGIMTWGIVGLVAIVAAWGIVLAITIQFGLNPEQVIPLGPQPQPVP